MLLPCKIQVILTPVNFSKKILMNSGISREKLLQILTRAWDTNCEGPNFLKITQKWNVILQHRTSMYIITSLNFSKKIPMNYGISREKLLQILTGAWGTNCEGQNFLKITQKWNIILQHRTSMYVITSLNFSGKISKKFDCYKQWQL